MFSNLYYVICGNVEVSFSLLLVQLWDGVSEEAKDLVRGLLTLNPEHRLTADQCLRHPWLANTQAAASADGPNAAPLPPSAAQGQQSSDRELKTVENLRQLGSGALSFKKELSAERISPAGSSKGLGRLVEKVPFLGAKGPSASPISQALDYDLAPIRRLSSIARQDDAARTSEDPMQLTRLKVALDLVGTKAGIQDARAGTVVTGPGSPVAARGVRSSPDHFADLDAAYVEEESHEPHAEDGHGR